MRWSGDTLWLLHVGIASHVTRECKDKSTCSASSAQNQWFSRRTREGSKSKLTLVKLDFVKGPNVVCWAGKQHWAPQPASKIRPSWTFGHFERTSTSVHPLTVTLHMIRSSQVVYSPPQLRNSCSTNYCFAFSLFHPDSFGVDETVHICCMAQAIGSKSFGSVDR